LAEEPCFRGRSCAGFSASNGQKGPASVRGSFFIPTPLWLSVCPLISPCINI
jgi:hypothetical protein